MTKIIILSLANVVILFSLIKWKVIECYELRKAKWLPTWCDMCFFFWCGMIENTFLNLEDTLDIWLVFKVFIFSLCGSYISLIAQKIYTRI